MDFLQFVLRDLGNKCAKSVNDYIKKEKDRKLREKLAKNEKEARKAYDNSLVCANCGSVISEGNNFCTQCGFDKIVLGKEYKRIQLENERLKLEEEKLKWEREHPKEALEKKEIEYLKNLIEIEKKIIEEKKDDINNARKQLYDEYYSLRDKLECPNCGASISKSQNFCGICRANFSETGIIRYDTIEFKSKLAAKYYLAFEENGEKDNFIEQLKRELKVDKTNSNNCRLQNEVNKEIEVIFYEIMNNMVECPAGKFMMGSNSGILGIGAELGRNSDEIQHQVIISKPYKIGKYPVTQKIFKIIMGFNGANKEYGGYDKPVVNVSWNNAQKFCNILNLIFSYKLPIGYKFDLPTEAQWEYACRAGTNSALNNGKNLTKTEGLCINLDEVAWYHQNSNDELYSVGQKKPNAWGIYDMHGNVREWCRDWYGSYPCITVTDPIGPNNGNCRVVRGGTWESFAKDCRSVSRDKEAPDSAFHSNGFRLALVSVE